MPKSPVFVDQCTGPHELPDGQPAYFIWILDERSFDRFYPHADALYRVVESQQYTQGEPFPVAVTPTALAKLLKNNFPEIENTARVLPGIQNVLRYGAKSFDEESGACADPAFLSMFSVSFLAGNPQTALSQPNSLVVTEQFARKYFEQQDPLAKPSYWAARKRPIGLPVSSTMYQAILICNSPTFNRSLT